MTLPDDNALPDDLAELWNAERARPGISPDRQARWRSALEAKVGLLPDGGTDGANHAATETSPRRTGAQGQTQTGLARLTRQVAFGTTMFVAGGVTSTLVSRALSHPPVTQTVYVNRTVTERVGVPAAPAVVVPSETAVQLPAVAAHRETPLPSDPDRALAAERVLIEIARTAVSRGHGEAALRALTRHAYQFPHGRLTEEREMLRVLALVADGNLTEANARANAFRRQFPQSLSWPAIQSALTPAP